MKTVLKICALFVLFCFISCGVSSGEDGENDIDLYDVLLDEHLEGEDHYDDEENASERNMVTTETAPVEPLILNKTTETLAFTENLSNTSTECPQSLSEIREIAHSEHVEHEEFMKRHPDHTGYVYDESSLPSVVQKDITVMNHIYHFGNSRNGNDKWAIGKHKLPKEEDYPIHINSFHWEDFDNTGSGFVIKFSNGVEYFFSNQHVLAKENYATALYRQYGDCDVSFRKMLNGKAEATLKMRDRPIKDLEKVIVAGMKNSRHNGKNRYHYEERIGYILPEDFYSESAHHSKLGRSIYFPKSDGTDYRGFSGSAVIDMNGECVGVYSGGGKGVGHFYVLKLTDFVEFETPQ